MSDDEVVLALHRIEEKLDDILDEFAANRADIDSTRGHLIYGLGESLTLSQRITKLEEAMRPVQL